MSSDGQLPGILIVDDDPDDRFLIQQLMRKSGVANPLVIAENGVEAIDRLRQSCPAGGGKRLAKFALVFLDVKMPLVDGFEVLRWIRKKKAFRRTKVILLSSSDEPADIARAKALRADGYFVKFPRPLIMAAAIRQALNGDRCGKSPPLAWSANGSANLVNATARAVGPTPESTDKSGWPR